MPQATRVGDLNTGHDACPPTPLETGSNNVLINGKKAGRVTDSYVPHGCDAHSPHSDVIVEGSKSVFINGRNSGRIGDSVVLAGEVMEGSSNVIIGG